MWTYFKKELNPRLTSNVYQGSWSHISAYNFIDYISFVQKYILKVLKHVNFVGFNIRFGTLVKIVRRQKLKGCLIYLSELNYI
ncbi:hypothetical protein HanXRQr2_Chr13g0619561 [Helianthus annuus]|uniref:Uncharacterized protein n=1 Tax=Helianthus annuus TaxID=4232 RepID=A0A9K3EMQ1_HELAN|nr:hypothetical protein HanXRQr2_Chr13g0619561 [Helianthus annuus]KAJ0851671.1 hypothetical protein HanPSC8_Chr13g0594761 [Helianthus annuus]